MREAQHWVMCHHHVGVGSENKLTSRISLVGCDSKDQNSLWIPGVSTPKTGRARENCVLLGNSSDDSGGPNIPPMPPSTEARAAGARGT